MKNISGELKPGKVVLAVVVGCAIAWLVYSRFSFNKEENQADRIVVIERQLQQTKDATDKLRQRVEGIERRVPEKVAPPVPKSKAQQKAVKGK